MPFQFQFDKPPAGVALTDSRHGEDVIIAVREFTSTEDGQVFIRRLEGFVDEALSHSPVKISPSSVDHLIAVISRDGAATIYVNELSLRPLTRVNRAMSAGETVYRNDIVDIERLTIGISVPSDAGVLVLFSQGWRKGLFFDFSPLAGDTAEARAFDLEALLGQYYALLLRQEVFRLTDSEWNQLFAAKWFPFAGLQDDLLRDLLSHLRAGWDPDGDLLQRIAANLKRRLPSLVEAWKQHPSFAPHMAILSTAVDRFLADDYVSTTATLFPRIEGLIRTHMQLQGASIRPTASSMSRSSVDSKLDRDYSLLLPHRFETYLREVYFAGFDPNSPRIGISRHSVAHGVAGADEFTLKAAVLGMLVVHQLFYLFPSTVSQTRSDDKDPSLAPPAD